MRNLIQEKTRSTLKDTQKYKTEKIAEEKESVSKERVEENISGVSQRQPETTEGGQTTTGSKFEGRKFEGRKTEIPTATLEDDFGTDESLMSEEPKATQEQKKIDSKESKKIISNILGFEKDKISELVS